MNRPLALAGLLATALSFPRVRCFLFGHARPERAYLGGDHRSGLAGYRCSRCKTPAAGPGELLGLDDDVRGGRKVS